MDELDHDYETYSAADLKVCGPHAYFENPTTEPLLMAYSMNKAPVRVVDLASGEALPPDIREALTDPSVIKWAHNAQFERICSSRLLGLPFGSYLPPEQSRCTMVLAPMCGLPPSLEEAGRVLGLDRQKLTEGKDLVRFFCRPCAPTKSNGGRTRNLPEHDPEKWLRFKKYCVRDVEAGKDIRARLSYLQVPEFLWQEYALDQRINDRGVLIDMPFVRAATAMNDRAVAEATDRLKELTGLRNPNSVSQMKAWLAQHGVIVDKLEKESVADLLASTVPDDVRAVLELRTLISKSSTKKYQAMVEATCSDHRARGMFQFYGASRTGRFSGKRIQLQNMVRNDMSGFVVEGGKHGRTEHGTPSHSHGRLRGSQGKVRQRSGAGCAMRPYFADPHYGQKIHRRRLLVNRGPWAGLGGWREVEAGPVP